jgi:hypothetical protein
LGGGTPVALHFLTYIIGEFFMDTNAAKTTFPQRKGQICINNDFRWVLDGAELTSGEKLDLQIGGQWISGFVCNSKQGLFWCSWEEGVNVQITVGLKSRRGNGL